MVISTSCSPVGGTGIAQDLATDAPEVRRGPWIFGKEGFVAEEFCFRERRVALVRALDGLPFSRLSDCSAGYTTATRLREIGAYAWEDWRDRT